jgi:hypothetical protein
VTALARAGITGVDDLAVLTRRELAAIPGLGAGMIAAIRLVVPEPSAAARSAAPAGAVLPPAEPDDEESPVAPAIPSFDSLRAPRRASAVDLLVPEPPAATAPAAAARSGPAPASAPRPPDYADLLRLGMHVLRTLARVPGRVAVRSVQQPVHCLRRLLPG